MATGITLGVPVTDLAVSGGGKREGAFSRDPSVVDSGFSGLVEMLVPGDAPPDADREGSEGSDQATDTWPRIPFDATALMSSRVEPARWKAEALAAALLGDVPSTRGPSETDSLRVAADQALPGDEADVDGGHGTFAVSALPVVLAAPMRLPQSTADWTQAANSSAVPTPESTVYSTMDVPLDPAGEWRHRHGQPAPVSRGQAPSDARSGWVPAAAIGERREVIDPFQPIRSSGTNQGPSSREDLDGAGVSTRASQAAGGAIEPPHAEATKAAQSTATDEARSAATAELRHALSPSRATSQVPGVAEDSPGERTRAHDPQVFRGGSAEAAASQSQLSTGLSTVSASWSGTAGGEHGRERPGSGAGVFDEHAQSLRRGPLGSGPLSGAADPFVLKDLSGIGARASAPQGQAPGDTLPDVPRQVVRAVHLQWRQGIGEARLQLKPDHLGHLTVTLRVESGLVTAVLRTESRTAMERIEAHQQELRAALEQQGLRLDRLVVEVHPDARGRRQPAEAPLPERRTSQPRDGQPEFDLGAFVSP